MLIILNAHLLGIPMQAPQSKALQALLTDSPHSYSQKSRVSKNPRY